MSLRFSFAHRISSASAENDGAITTSVKTLEIASAVSAPTSPLTATMPPNALTGSAAWARSWASATVGASATPQGLACFTITHAGRSNRLTSCHAASVSSTFRYDISLPFNCTAESHQLSTPGSRYRAPVWCGFSP